MIVPGLVSTIIPVYNRPQLVQESIGSVLAQSYRPIEIIVVDDGSSDSTLEVLRRLVKEHPTEIRLYGHENFGPGVARETGRSAAKGEFIQYLDSDDLLLPRKFELQVKGLCDNPDCQASYGKTREYEYGSSPRDVPCKRTGERIATMFPAFVQSRWWSTSTPLFRRTVTDHAGPWTSLWNEEDWEYDCRIAAQGVKLHYCTDFVSDRRLGQADQLSMNGGVDPEKLADRAKAHVLIFNHAKRYGISPEAQEMQHFARELFLLSRQCGAAGLVEEACELFELSRCASEATARNRLQFKVYWGLAMLAGWNRVGRWACRVNELGLLGKPTLKKCTRTERV